MRDCLIFAGACLLALAVVLTCAWLDSEDDTLPPATVAAPVVMIDADLAHRRVDR